jgi:hypothetical protein
MRDLSHTPFFRDPFCLINGFVPEIFALYELSRPRISKRSPRNLEKSPFVAGLTMEMPQTF